MISWSDIEDAASGRHLVIMGALYPNDLAGVETLILLGPKEPGFWPQFVHTAEYGDGLPDPMDRWSTRMITDLATQFDGQAFYPFGGPPYQPFYQWALATGRAWPSPINLLVHDTAGLLVSYRGALGLPQRLEIPKKVPLCPCDSCADQPCRSTCPVGAFDSGIYDVSACKAHISSAAGKVCMRGCLARRACPISARYPRNADHSAFHMEAFL
ncbi:ferredoxin [Thalassobius sp. Cn5-15]|uniref:ferredoxin n=1 Tax=Thalassobius sp. Cn5-15 TaxID=2917763 RepID=UPI002103A093|nr:ferredoxin [Thalassobius sp. Cn5-15]